MMMLSKYSRVLINSAAMLAAVVLSQAVSAAGDAEKGKVLADTCKGCHAVEGYNNVYPTYHVPKLAGQKEAYIVSTLSLYRDGQRKHPTMSAQAASLSDQDIQDISTYIAGLAGEQSAAANGTAPVSAQVCIACHGQTGISPIPTNPNLAGQHQDYLSEALAQYRRGERKGPNAIAMQAQLTALSEDDQAAIVAYFAQQSGLDTLPK